jgi:cysteine sulfinate desulfinase/cysteine desulfurase-like protein
MIYLDNAATTRISSGVADVMTKAMLEQNANPSAIYEIARDNRAKIEQARKDIDETEKDVKIFINKLVKAVITLKEVY